MISRLHPLVGIMASCMFAGVLTTPVVAQTTPAPNVSYVNNLPYTPDLYVEPINQPSTVQPSNTLPDAVGRAVEKSMVRRNVAIGVAATAAVVVGGYGLKKLIESGWAGVKQVGFDTATSAGGFAVSGCVLGGIAGAGLFSLPGCGMGALSGAIAGGFIGAAGSIYNLTADGAVKAKVGTTTSQSGVTGSGVVAANSVNTTDKNVAVTRTIDNSSNRLQLGFASGKSTANWPINNSLVALCNVSDSQSSRYCMALRVQVSSGTRGTDQACLFDDPSRCVSTRYGLSTIGILDTTDMKFIDGTGSSGFGTTASKCPQGHSCLRATYPSGLSNDVNLRANDPKSMWNDCTGQSCVMYYAQDGVTAATTSSDAASVPTFAIQPVADVPTLALPWAKNLTADSLDKPLDPVVVAAIANAAWKAAGTTASVPYDAQNPVTAQDVQQVYAEKPNLQVTPRNLMQPIPPNTTGGNSVSPLTPTTPIVNSPSTATGSSSTGSSTNPTNTKEVADQDLDSLWGGTLGDVTEPIRAAAVGPFAAFLSPTVSMPIAACPSIKIDLLQMMTGQTGGTVSTSEQICNFLSDLRPAIIAIVHAWVTISMAMLVMRRIV